MIPKYFKKRKDAVYVYPDGREVCEDTAAGRREYFNRTRLMAARQNESCAICQRFLIQPSFDHQDGRGMNAAFRDDRIEIDGKWYNAALCFLCNHTKGGRRFHWVDGKYIQQGE